MPSIAQLNERHPSLAPAHSEDLWALYSGGERFRCRIKHFVNKRPRESNEHFGLRVSEVHYRNYIGPIIDYFASMLFSARPQAVAITEDGSKTDPPDYYSEFFEDCDLNGGDLEAFFKARITEAMVDRRSWFVVEHGQDSGEQPKTIAEAEKRGIMKCSLRALGDAEVLDWEVDERGALSWALVHSSISRRASLAGGRDTVTERWEHFLPDRVDRYEITYKKNKKPDPSTDVPATGSTPHRFARVPVVCLELPDGLWVAERLESPQLAHLRVSNAQTWGMTAACFAMLVLRLQDPEEFDRVNQGAGYQISVGKEDSAEWIAPNGAPFAAIDVEIKSTKDEIFRIAHQMALGVENNAAAVGRSADSKDRDAEATRVALQAYSKIVKESIELVYDMVAGVRGDAFKWSIGGLDDFAALDVQGMVAMLAEIEGLGGIPSKTWNAEAKTRIAESVLRDIDEKTKQTIREEIFAAATEADELAKAMRAAVLEGEDPADGQGDEGSDGAPARGAGAAAPSGRKAAAAGRGSKPGAAAAAGSRGN